LALPELSSCATWECINSFAPWFAAFGTVLVSGIALWLSWKDRLIQVNARFSYGLIPSADPDVLDREVYILEFINVGSRTVTITNYEWRIFSSFNLFRRIRYFTFPHRDAELGSLCSMFPVELSDGKQGQVFHKIEFFEELEHSDDHLFSQTPSIAFFRIFTFTMILSTTVGKKVKVTIPFDVRVNIWQRYLSMKRDIDD